MAVTDLELQYAGVGADHNSEGSLQYPQALGRERTDVPYPPATFLMPDETVPLGALESSFALEAEDLRVDSFRAAGILVIDADTARVFAKDAFISPAIYRELAFDPEVSRVWELIDLLGADNVAIGGLDIDGHALPRVPGERQISIRDPLDPYDRLTRTEHDYMVYRPAMHRELLGSRASWLARENWLAAQEQAAQKGARWVPGEIQVDGRSLGLGRNADILRLHIDQGVATLGDVFDEQRGHPDIDAASLMYRQAYHLVEI